MTQDEALAILVSKGWGVKMLGLVHVVGPVIDGTLEAKGHGITIQSAVQNAMKGMAEHDR